MYPQANFTPSSTQTNTNSNESLILKKNTVQEIRTDIIQIQGKRLIFGNTVYQIPNIAGFSTAKIINKFPWMWCLIIMILLLINKDIFFSDFGRNDTESISTIINSLLVLSLFGLIFYWASMPNKYGLLIISSAGSNLSSIIIHEDKKFIDKVIKVLSLNIDSSYEKYYIINFNKKTIHQSNTSMPNINFTDTTINDSNLSMFNDIDGNQEQSNTNYTKKRRSIRRGPRQRKNQEQSNNNYTKNP
ncbi:MAG TPA: hypothetical protein DEF47_23940 [Herpetosiphon sp.]|nr:hypothetical protein [Herpetosiphon sp.]HBW52946.1 hypothetical protein [Herpetosiphon sp.]